MADARLRVLLSESEIAARVDQLADTLAQVDDGWTVVALLQGAIPFTADLMRAFDLFCLTSDYGEGCSNVTLEAMATGLPVISTNFGGASELLDESTGTIVPVQDDAALATAILQLLDDPARREAMGRAGRQRAVEHFSLETMIRKRETLLLELLEKRPRENRVQ